MNELMARLLLYFVLVMSLKLEALESPQKSRDDSSLSATLRLPTSPDSLTDRQRRWARKAAKRYAEAQEKKWRNWNESMFERK